MKVIFQIASQYNLHVMLNGAHKSCKVYKKSECPHTVVSEYQANVEHNEITRLSDFAVLWHHTLIKHQHNDYI